MADKIQIIFKEIVEVAGSGSGAAIDDDTVSTEKTWSSQKISDELSTKADSSHTHTSAEITDFNTQVDSKISTHNTDTTAHNDIRTALNNKAEIDDTTVSTSKTYSSQKIEDRLSTKANATHTHNLNDLSNVDVSSATNGQVLSFDSTSGLWIPATVSGGGGSGNYKQIADIILSTSATEVIISGLNNNYIDVFTAFKNTSGSHTYLYIYVSYDNGTTWVGFDCYGILVTSTGAVDKWNGSWGYLKNNSTLWSKLEIKRLPNTNSVYIKAPTRSNSNNRWRHSQAFAENITGNITDIKITTDGTATFDIGSQITVFTGD